MTIGTYVCQFQLLVLFSEKEEWLTYLCMVTRGPRPSEVLMAYVVISCAQLLTNCCTSSPSGLCPQHVGPRRAAVIPSASESLCNFGEIYTQKTYPTASFFALPPSLCFPSLSGLPELRHSLLLLRDITLCTASGSWFHLFTLSPAFSLPVRFWLQIMHLNFPLRQVQAVMQGTRVWFIYTNTHRADLK